MAKRIAVLACALVLLSLVPVTVWAQAGTVRVGAAFGFGMYDIEDINDFNDVFGRYYSDLEDMIDEWCEDDWYTDCGADISFSADELGGGAVFAGTVEYMVSPVVSVGLEFVPLKSSGESSLRWHEWYDDYYYYYYESEIRSSADFEASANLLSLFAIYRVPLGSTGASFRLGGGAGYLFGAKLSIDESGRWESYDDYYGYEEGHWSGSVEASGSGLAFHGLVGIEYPIMPQLLLTGDIAYRFASVDELEVDSLSGDAVDSDLEEGEILKWDTDEEDGLTAPYLSTDEGDEIGLDFSGLYITFGIAYVF